MLDAYPLNPILPAQDARRAEAFYRDVLGLRELTPPGADPMLFGAGENTKIALTELPDRVPPSYPVIAFMVSDIEELVNGLTAFCRAGSLKLPRPRRRRRGSHHRLRSSAIGTVARQRGKHPRTERDHRPAVAGTDRGGLTQARPSAAGFW